MSDDTPTIGFLGAGRMATALATGLVKSEITPPDHVIATDLLPAARESFAAATGGRVFDDAGEVARLATTLVVAVKPHHVAGLLADLGEQLSEIHLVVSVAAGIPLARLQSHVEKPIRFVRVMPNTPCLVGTGASGYALGRYATKHDGEFVGQLLSTVGLAVEVPEPQLDAVTGLSGSGPAYVYQMIEALSDGGVRCGLPRETATRLAAQTLLGAARMVLETGEHPGALKDAVTSPGGTTIAGLHALESGGLRGTLMNAVVAATQRSVELGHS